MRDDPDALRDLLRRELREASGGDETAVFEAALERVDALRSPFDDDSERAATLDRVAALARMQLDRDWTAPPSARRLALGALHGFVRATDGDGPFKPEATALTELVADALRPELEGWTELRAYRDRRLAGSPDRDLAERRLQARRKRIRARIQRELARDRAVEPAPRLGFRHWRTPL